MNTMQTDAPLVHQSLEAANRHAREQARMVVDGRMTLDAPYQRGHVWTERQQRNLVRSWLLGVPVPAIIVNRRYQAFRNFNYSSDADYAVIDGKQRLTAAKEWFFGDLAVPASWFPSEAVEQTVDTDDGPYVMYKGLALHHQRFVANRALLPVAEANLPSVQAEAEVYGLVNGGGVAQTADDMARAERIAQEG